MKNTIRTTLLAGTVASLIIAGCAKKSDVTVEPPATNSSAPTITVSDGYGALAAVGVNLMVDVPFGKLSV